MESLKVLQIVCRHGFRTPALTTESYLGDPNSDFLSHGLGQLTPRGKSQMFGLGKYLRQRYDHFLTENPRSLKARSSELDRCMDSTSCLLAGMYPPRGVFRWNADLDWQPVPVYTEPINQDKVLLNYSKINEMAKQLKKNQLPEKLEEFRLRMEQVLGQEIDRLRMLKLSDVIVSQHKHGLKLPENVSEIVPESYEALQFIVDFFCDNEDDTLQLGGGLLDVLKTNMQEYLGKGQSSAFLSLFLENRSYKTHLFCTSDVTMVALMKLLGIRECIGELELGAALVFEFHEIQDNHFVRIYLNNDTLHRVSDFQLIELPNLSFDCPLEEFLNLLK